MQQDFAQLYAMLDLQPDCTLEEFQRAYRRAIGELHPDRDDTQARSAEEQSQLRDLISMHSAATAFYRRHGRLPGGRMRSIGGFFARNPTAMQPTERVRRDEYSSGHRWLLPVTLLGFIAWQLLEKNTAPHLEYADAHAAALAQQSHGGFLLVGMDAPNVLAIQGMPDSSTGSEWRYGPSWLRFDEGVLVDWYSSPARPLKTATGTPPEN